MKYLYVLLALIIFASSPLEVFALSQSPTLVQASNQYLSVADNASLSLTGAQTWEGYFNFTTLPALGDANMLLNKYVTATNNRSFSVELVNNAGTYQFQTRTSATGAGGTGGTTVNWTPSTGTWYFIRFVYSTAGTVDIYVDDMTTKIGTSTGLDTSIFDSTAPFEIGHSDFRTNNFNGRVSLVRVWTGSHTTNDKCTVYGTATTNMQAEWSLDNVLTDASGNGNTLTNNNTAVFSSGVPTCLQPATATGANYYTSANWIF